MITGDLPERYRRRLEEYPEEYKTGIGKEGVEKLVEFVEAGGVLVTFDDACEFAIEKMHLDVRNAVEDLNTRDFFCSGSTIRVCFDPDHPLAYGMPETGFVVFTSSPAFEIIPGRHNDRYRTVVRYPESDLLQSGWLIGEAHLAGKSGMVCAQKGEGKVVLIGFRVQHRYQTDGTYKLLFNTIIH